MAVDKNLFMHDLAVVAILKNEGPYLKEWLDYHLLAGVDHFYLYDNDSPDNQREVAAPYVEAGLVDYFSAPGKIMQTPVYNEAIRRFKFHCRYMAFIDGDEFIYPKTNRNIAEVVDEILSHNPKAASLAINWHCFGSNGQEKADYSRGVLERFTRRAPNNWILSKNPGNSHVKTIANPRVANFMFGPHNACFFEGMYAINELGNIVSNSSTNFVTAEKIIINHYHCKTWEEYRKKTARGDAYFKDKVTKYDRTFFDMRDRNDEFDDGILRYRDARAKTYQPPDKSRANEKLLNALMTNLSPTLLPNTPPDFYREKMETFLTCRAVSSYLKSKLPDDTPAKFFEEASLKAILKAFDGMSLADARIFLREMPEILNLPYPVVDDVRQAAIKIIPQLMNVFRFNNMWKDYVEFDCLQRLLKTWH